MTNQPLIAWLGDCTERLGDRTSRRRGFLGPLCVHEVFPKALVGVGGHASVIFGFFVASIYPDVIQPLFNTLRGSAQTKWKTAEPRIQALGSAIGVRATDIMSSTHQGKAYIATPTSLVSARRSASSFTTTCSRIIAPMRSTPLLPTKWDIGGRCISSKASSSAALRSPLALYLLFRYMSGLIDRRRVARRERPAGAFRVLLLGQLAIALSLPIQNGISRWFERQADEHAPTLSKKPQAFIEAEKRLAKLNKSNVTPSHLNVFLFASHPPIVERIQMAEQWKDKTPSK